MRLERIMSHLTFTENKNGVNLPDDESIAVSAPDSFPALPTHTINKRLAKYWCVCVCHLQSTASLHQEHDISSKDKDCSPESKSTTGNTDVTVTSAVSTRPALTRQGKCVSVCVFRQKASASCSHWENMR